MLRSGLVCVLALGSSLAPAAITMEMVTVGDTNNPADPLTGYGSVPYAYQIGKYEVRNSEYVEFLNSVASTDTYGLYNTDMEVFAQGGITRAGASGSYTYSVKSGYENMPVVFVSFHDAVRFANWMANGQPVGGQGAGTTETGSYTLLTDGSTTTNVSARDAGATWVIPTENEWYKAAYHQPSSSGGPADDYWAYPMQTDFTPISAAPPGSSSPAPSRTGNFFREDGQANGYNDGYAVGFPIAITEVGAYTLSVTYYGTFDQGGNLQEWVETITSGTSRGQRGGNWSNTTLYLRSDYRIGALPDGSSNIGGFRLALIPEPACCAALFTVAIWLGVRSANRLRRR